MLRRGGRYILNNYVLLIHKQKRSFLTNEYKCEAAWNNQKSSSILNSVKLNDFFATLSQNYASKGVISAIDVDVFANAIKDAVYLDELKDLLHKLRMSAETGNTLDSTHHATVRNYVEYGNMQDLVSVLKDPLKYGVFLDNFAANVLLDKLLSSENYELAANVAAQVMLQEDFSNEITCALSQFACYKYLKNHGDISLGPPKPEAKQKVEEIKIRVKFLRNFYHDDHFDIKELPKLSGKSLAWLSRRSKDNVSKNLEIIGWMHYQKYDTLSLLCEDLKKTNSFKIHQEVIELMQKQADNCENEKENIENCISLLKLCPKTDSALEDSIKNLIEDAINKTQINDISTQQTLFQTWSSLREEKLKEQIQRLSRAQRVVEVEEKQKELKVEEQKLWFFENEDEIDLEIEKKEKLENKSIENVKEKSDDNYIPPEVVRKRK